MTWSFLLTRSVRRFRHKLTPGGRNRSAIQSSNLKAPAIPVVAPLVPLIIWRRNQRPRFERWRPLNRKLPEGRYQTKICHSKLKAVYAFDFFNSIGVRRFGGDSDLTFERATDQRRPATWRVSFNIANLAFSSGKTAATAFSPSSTALLRPLISVAGMPYVTGRTTTSALGSS